MSETLDSATIRKLKEQLDKEAILECETRLCRASDRLDKEASLAAFHPDAVIDVGEFCGSREELWDWTAYLYKQDDNPTTFHYILNYNCDLDGDTAHVEIYWYYVCRRPSGYTWQAGGRYADRLEKRDGAWKIAMRVNMIEWAGEMTPLPVPLQVAETLTNGGPAHGKTDITYRRPLTNKRAKAMPAGVYA